MKRTWLILALLVVGSVFFLGISFQEQPQAEANSKQQPETPEIVGEANQPAPQIRFEKIVHDFGEVGPGTKNLCEFKFKNAGNALLKITDVSKTCGCTPFTLAKKKYAPGESGTLKVEYKTSRRPGSTSKHLYVKSNDKAKPRVTLTIKARISMKVAHEPKSLNLLLNKGNAACPQITLRSLDGQAFSIKSFKSTADCITADYEPSVKSTKFVIQPKVDVEKLKERSKGNIDIELTHPECDKVTISFSALPKFKIDPPVLILLNAKPQEPIARELWILSNYDEDFEIGSVSSKKGLVKVLSQKKVGNRYEFNLQITPPAPDRQTRIFTDVFYVNLKDDETLEIICRGFYPRK